MRPGFQLVENSAQMPTDSEMTKIRLLIRDCHVLAIAEWLAKQKPKLRAKFNSFLYQVENADPSVPLSPGCVDVSERFARDIIQPQYHNVLAGIILSSSEVSDVLHILSLHMSRANVMASVPTKRDETPKLLRAIAQEDHLFETHRVVHHESPKTAAAQAITRARMNEPLPHVARTKMIRPEAGRSSPFAVFPSSEPMESTMHTEMREAATKPSYRDTTPMYKVLNSPTCL